MYIQLADAQAAGLTDRDGCGLNFGSIVGMSAPHYGTAEIVPRVLGPPDAYAGLGRHLAVVGAGPVRVYLRRSRGIKTQI